MMADTGLVDIRASAPYDNFGNARGEAKARLYDVHGYAFLAQKPE